MNKKQTNNKTMKRLAAYSAVAASAMVASTPASAEVIEFNVDPDSTLTAADTVYYVFNLNQSGAVADTLNDIEIGASSNSGGDWMSVWWYGLNNASAYGLNLTYSSPGQIITKTITTAYGAKSTYTTTGTTFWTYAKPMPLSAGSSVGPSSPPENWITSRADAWLASIYSSSNLPWGSWIDTKEKYLGLKFYAFTSEIVGADTLWDSTLHYGFVYMSVGKIGTGFASFTIHGYAYEDTPETAIIFKPIVGIEDRKLDNNVSIYSHGRNVNVGIKGLSNTKGSITVYNTLGQQIQQETIKGSANTFGVKGEGAGVYLVKVSVDGEGSSTRKVYIN